MSWTTVLTYFMKINHKPVEQHLDFDPYSVREVPALLVSLVFAVVSVVHYEIIGGRVVTIAETSYRGVFGRMVPQQFKNESDDVVAF